FSVVADEVKLVSKQIAALSHEMNLKAASATESVNKGFEMIQEVATIDMNANIQMKENIDLLMKGLLDQSNNTVKIMNETADSAINISNTIRDMIVKMQFQDKNSQVAFNSSQIILSIIGLIDNIKNKTENTLIDRQMTIESVEQISANITLGDIRNQFICALENSEFAEYIPYNIKNNIKNIKEKEDVELF
ncbi:MAG: hypothetical protein WCJ33_05405, partial [Pseudomonadota bacterium]